METTLDVANAFAPKATIPRGDDDKRSMTLPPALVEAIHDDPAALQPAARVMAATLLHEQFVESSAYTPAQKLALTETLAKLGNMEPKKIADQQQGGGVSIMINIPTIDSSPAKTLVIDSTSSEATFELPEALHGTA